MDLSERNCDGERTQDLDELNERLVENVTNAAVSQIGYVRTNGKKRLSKPW